MRIINIAGVQFAVSDQDYNYYWNQRNVGEESDSFITACRRILDQTENTVAKHYK